jgi:hypothetical protein
VKKPPHVSMTPHGPMADGSSPALLAELLDQVEEEFTAAGAPLDRWLAAGIGADEVSGRLAEVGLAAPDELLVWFGWHNGLAPAHDGEFPQRALPNFVPASIELAVGLYRDMVLNFEAPPRVPRHHFMFGAGEGWLRIVDDLRGCAVDCSGGTPSARPPRIRSADDQFDEDDPNKLGQAVSLCTYVTWWLESLHTGAISWNLAEQRWDIDFADMPATQRAVLFS